MYLQRDEYPKDYPKTNRLFNDQGYFHLNYCPSNTKQQPNILIMSNTGGGLMARMEIRGFGMRNYNLSETWAQK